MAKKKIYAVKRGNTIGLFDSWDECRESVDGFPNAQFKGFTNIEEAKKYLESDTENKDKNSEVDREKKDGNNELNKYKNDNVIEVSHIVKEHMDIENRRVFDSLTIYKMMEDKRGNVFFREDGEWKNIRFVLPKNFTFSYLNADNEELSFKSNLLRDDVLYSFVDGSYNVNEGIYGGGILFLTGVKFARISIRSINEENAEMRNVAGEILASSIAMNIAKLMGKKKLVIAYDYNGIEEWALGNWKRNKIGTKKYKEEFDYINKDIEIVFEKVEAHSGHALNDEADYLAKLSVGNLNLR